jgi:hypothetical protein
MYVLRFIRAYAEAIGLEPEETVLRYEEVDPSDATLAFNAEPPPPTPIDGRSAPSDPSHAPLPLPVSDSEAPLAAAPASPDGGAPVAKRPPSWSQVSALTSGSGAQPSASSRRPGAMRWALAAFIALTGAAALWAGLQGR